MIRNWKYQKRKIAHSIWRIFFTIEFSADWYQSPCNRSVQWIYVMPLHPLVTNPLHKSIAPTSDKSIAQIHCMDFGIYCSLLWKVFVHSNHYIVMTLQQSWLGRLDIASLITRNAFNPIQHSSLVLRTRDSCCIGWMHYLWFVMQYPILPRPTLLQYYIAEGTKGCVKLCCYCSDLWKQMPLLRISK